MPRSVPEFEPVRRRVLAALGGLALVRGARAQVPALAAAPTTLIVPTPAGNSSDRVGRLLAQALSGTLDAPIRVENIAGNGGVTGTNAIAAAPADGSVLGLAVSSAMVGGKLLSRSARFNLSEDFEWLAIVGTYPVAMVIARGSPVRGFDSWLEAARKAPLPLIYASFGSGSGGHLAGAFLRYEQGANLTHRTLDSLNEGYALLGERKIDVLFDGLPNAMVEAARLGHRIIAVTSATRAELLPNVPAFGEFWKESFEVWIGLVAPRGLQKDAYLRLTPAVGAVLGERRYVDALRGTGLTLLGLSGRDIRAFLETEVVRHAKLIARLNDEGLRQ